ncbi:synaptonemal complex protein 1 [Umezakia ovalisporum]|uniref:hypothetical protein n=1 Tax=Umezakia ovalisporum TaxID=75695 RepID=UPI0024767073|nr:hypothetical protein [Umezakia ovalisporum]MDH6084819.1 hypothetical protein [Umezakia ovalisporum TAC611]MDH6089452.1 hypothetical protein [Umezakia ovalisporum Ak1311]
MLLNQLVEINEKGSIASSVNFAMIDDSTKNLSLCESFIFNYDSTKPQLSTVGILDAVRRSYHSANQPNIHLLVQQYGRGKSHFAIAIANFFQKSFHSPEVQGILSQVEKATAGKNQAIAEGLKVFKQNQPHQHLVICLSGDQGGDIRKQFLQQLVKSLGIAGIQDSLAHHVCSEPLRYLESLNAEDRIKANSYLQSIGSIDGNLDALIRLLRQNTSSIIPTVKKIAVHITGFTPDFAADINIQEILEDLIKNYCTGENACFQGILILFDELNYYLKSWAADEIGAGGTALQNITNICENYKGKIAFLSFTQIHPSKAVGIAANIVTEYQKIATRLAPKDGTTYDNPASSLELVVQNLLLRKNDFIWQKFHFQWHNTLRREAEIAYENRIKIYKNKGWCFQDFYTHLAEGCFPLHPLTTYLLCNLDFTQDRTAIQFIKGYVKNFIATQPVENAGKVNYIYPIALVDTFVENFSNYPVYKHYKKAVDLVASAENEDELIVLKALFLYEASGEKLTKPDRENHQEILSNLTGLPKSRLQAGLDQLEKERDLIYYRPEIKLYRFWESINPTIIQEEIAEKIKSITTSINDVVAYCAEINILKQYPSNITISGTKFAQDNNLVPEDWQYRCKIYGIDQLIQALESNRTLKDITEKGIFAYVLAETQEELRQFRQTVDNYLSKSPLKNRVAVAIPTEETGNLARVILQIKELEKTESADKRLLGKAYQEQLQRWQEEANTRLKNLLNDCTYHCIGLEKIPSAEQCKPERVISLLLQDLYPLVPPVAEIDKMRSDHQTGKKIVAWTAKQIFIKDDISQQTLPDRSYSTVLDQIFVKSWNLLKKTSDKYVIQEPTHEKIRVAWDKISQITDLEGLPYKIVELDKIWQELSAPPFGYGEYNFTMLLAGWLARHRQEVSLKGSVKLIAKKRELVPVQEQSLQSWSNTDILQNPTTFVQEWVVKQKSKLIRRQPTQKPILPATSMDYEQAQQYIVAVTDFLASHQPDELEKAELTKKTKYVSAEVAEIDNWFQPVEVVENLPPQTQLAVLLPLYPQLLKPRPAKLILPTQQQCHRFSQAAQNLTQKIDEILAAENNLAESLSTEKACSAYKTEIEAMIDQVREIANLPPHIYESLQNALGTCNIRLTEIRYQADQGKKQVEDMQIMQNIRQCNSPTKLKTICLAQQALAEIKNLQSRCHYPQKFQDEITEIVQSIENKITEYRYALINLGNRIQSVTNLTELDILSTEYAKLDFIFQDAADYGDYQALQPQIQSLKHDLEEIKKLEDLYQKSDYGSCNYALAIIVSPNFKIYNTGRLQEKISQLEVNLQQKIQKFTAELQEYKHNLQYLSTVEEAQRLQKELIKRSPHYSGSEIETEYELILSELSLLIELLQITEATNLESLEVCQTQLEKLENWENLTQRLTPTLSDRLHFIRTEIKQTKSLITQKQQVAAQQWLEDLATSFTELNQLSDERAKLSAATNLLEQIQFKKSEYTHLLEAPAYQILETMERQCIQEQKKDITNQVLLLFQQLPRLEQQNLYERLGQIISDQAEE